MGFQDKSEFDRKHIISQILKKNGCRYTNADDIAWMMDFSVIRSYRKGGYIYMEGDEIRGFYVILHGKVEVSKNTETESKKILSYLHEGNYLGIAELFSFSHIVSGQCLTDCEIALISKEVFFEKLADNKGIILEFLKINSRIVETLENSMAIETAESKIRNYLKWLIRESGLEKDGRMSIYRRHTHEEIGGMLYLSRETVTKTLNALRDAGVLEITKDQFIITDAELIDQARHYTESHLGFYGSEN